MTDTNEVTLRFLDKNNRSGTLNVNSKSIGVGFVSVYQSNGFDYKDEYNCQLANAWNRSNPIPFQAKTIKGLIGKIKRHKYNLVPFIL